MTAGAGDAAHQRSHLALLTEVIEQFSQTRVLDAGWAASVLARIADTLQARTAALFLFEDGAMVCRAQSGGEDRVGLAAVPHDTVLAECVASGEARRLEDAHGVRLCAPLRAMGQTLGAVELRAGPAAFTEQDRDTLSALAAAAALALVNARLTEERVGQERLQRELELAGQVQRNLLPRDVPADSAVHGYNRPARGVSGDFYDLVNLADGRIVFALADVSGKGMNAALIMVKAATLFRSWARRVPDPGRLLARVEAELCETMSMGMFVTMVVGLYDPRTQSVRLSNAGHEPPLLRRADGCYVDFPASDPPLGVVGKLEGNRYRETQIELAGGALYLYTDGATEGRLADGSVAESAGVRALIEQHAALAPAARLEALAAHYGDELHDDLTWLVIEDPNCAQRARRPRRRRSGLLVEQSIPAQSDQLRIVRRLVQAAARQAGATGEWGADLALAVDEACQNIIRHGYGGDARGRIELRVKREGETLSVELEDRAPAVGIEARLGRALDELRPGGLGTFFMQRLTDGVRLLKPRHGPGNRLVLSKKLRSRNKNGPEEEPE